MLSSLVPLLSSMKDKVVKNLTSSNYLVSLPPTMLTVESANELFVNVSWLRPDTEGRGPLVAFELGYRRNATDCQLYEVLGPQLDCDNETVSFWPLEQTYFYAVKLSLAW